MNIYNTNCAKKENGEGTQFANKCPVRISHCQKKLTRPFSSCYLMKSCLSLSYPLMFSASMCCMPSSNVTSTAWGAGLRKP